MTTTSTRTTTRGREARRLALHYLEMVVAMVVGMFLLGPVWSLIPSLPHTTEVDALVMATDMAIGMAVWMRIRGHRWIGIVEMSSTMYLAFLVTLVPFWLGLIDGSTALTAGHVLMLPLMLAAMLWRRGDHTARGARR